MTVQKDFIMIVSGLPRSGTSMAMQMIEAGGLAALTDKIRTPDSDNPRGYYEFEPAKKTKEDPSWLADAPGKVVKMVYRLLYDLPQDREYRVVFVRREMDEILRSQEVMLKRLGEGAGPPPEQMAALFEAQIAEFQQWLPAQTGIAILYVHYKDVIADARRQAERIDEFLGGGLDVAGRAGPDHPRPAL